MRHLPHAALLALFMLPVAGHAAGMRCDGGLVDRGDLAVEVLNACGEPDLTDSWRVGRGHPNAFSPDVEQWYYNFGPRKLLQIVHIRNGRVSRIDADGYGFRTPGPRDCRPNDIERTMSKLRLLAQCGEPVQTDRTVVFRSQRRGRFGNVVPVQRETWIYNFGNSRLLRRVRLENGRIVDVDSEGRGFD